MMKVQVTVTLKPGVLDPQGKAVEGALASLGFGGRSGVKSWAFKATPLRKPTRIPTNKRSAAIGRDRRGAFMVLP